MVKWYVRTKRERAHNDPIELENVIAAQEITGLIHRAFQIDQMYHNQPKDKRPFDLTAYRPGFQWRMELKWNCQQVNAWDEAVNAAYERTQHIEYLEEIDAKTEDD